MRSFSYIPDASFSESTLFPPVLVWGFSDTPNASKRLMSFTYTLRVQWLWGLYLTVLMLTEFNGEFLLHYGC